MQGRAWGGSFMGSTERPEQALGEDAALDVSSGPSASVEPHTVRQRMARERPWGRVGLRRGSRRLC